MPESEVRVRLAVDVEAVRVGPCVAVRRCKPDQDEPLGRYLQVTDLGVRGGEPGEPGGRGCGSAAPPRSRPAAGLGRP
jgi:hypothetical protein